MKKQFFLVVFSFSLFYGMAQDNAPRKIMEIGLTGIKPGNYGAIYKRGNERNLLRLGFFNAGFSSSDNKGPALFFQTSGGFSIGWEHRKPIHGNLYAVSGLLGGFNVSYSKNNPLNSTERWVNFTYTPSLTPILGVGIQPIENLAISFEFLPALAYSTNIIKTYVDNNLESTTRSRNLNLYFDTNSYLFTVAWQLTRD